MAGLLSGFKSSARRMVRAAAFSAVLSIAGLLLALAGLGCLTAALWIAIALHQGTIFAFAFIGIVYVALGAILLALAAHTPRDSARRGRPGRSHDDSPSEARPPREPFVQLAEGFAMGMQAGRAARGSRR